MNKEINKKSSSVSVSSLVLSKEMEKMFQNIISMSKKNSEYVPFDRNKSVKKREKGFDVYFQSNL